MITSFKVTSCIQSHINHIVLGTLSYIVENIHLNIFLNGNGWKMYCVISLWFTSFRYKFLQAIAYFADSFLRSILSINFQMMISIFKNIFNNIPGLLLLLGVIPLQLQTRNVPKQAEIHIIYLEHVTSDVIDYRNQTLLHI